MPFDSRSEQLLAEFFKNERIRFWHNHHILVKQDDGRLSIWYPDFYLPDYGIVVEYFGGVGDPNYDRGTFKKKHVYWMNSLPLIPVYPKTLDGNWQSYLWHHISDVLHYRLDRFNNR